MASRTKAFHASLHVACTLLFVLVSVTNVCGVLATSPDPALCPYELGYSPVFNADGSQLFCTKGAETFTVDAAGANARALRGVGQSSLALAIGAVNRDFATFDKYVANDATFVQPPGAPSAGQTVPNFDPALEAFNRPFEFAPGIDVNANIDVSRFGFLGGDPLSVFVHIKEQTLNFVLEYDSIWRMNNVSGGQKLWQLYRAAFNPSIFKP
ncbi:hypothetical protein KFL_003150020 [Klebsormidium nitens]|uniref:Uncharacterized protein n=1 Tax=Klebsormidium nitens TaxID=105231 RepID=A0A1Y1IDN8_KLENI|nr:hypothetical protein KFL_003150020 [Klebsormidium nitens]|eukprot:GAQ86837.1 hypothetical protein KFL_003150020 [Klebsormidium nitens]